MLLYMVWTVGVFCSNLITKKIIVCVCVCVRSISPLNLVNSLEANRFKRPHIVSQILHENERYWTEGRRMSLTPPPPSWIRQCNLHVQHLTDIFWMISTPTLTHPILLHYLIIFSHAFWVRSQIALIISFSVIISWQNSPPAGISMQSQVSADTHLSDTAPSVI